MNDMKDITYCTQVPEHVQIETTARCNLSCVMCPRELLGYKLRRLPDMTLQQFRNIIDKLPAGIKMISVHGLGEPLLNGEIANMIKHANLKAPVLLVTNGLIFKKTVVEEILASKPSMITISIDSPYKDFYEKIRVGSDFTILSSNVLELVEIRNTKYKDIGLSIQMTVWEENIGHIIDMLNLCSNWGIESLNIVGIHTNSTQKIAEYIPKCQSILERAKVFAASKNIKFAAINMDFEDRVNKKLCDRPWRTMFIDVEGMVYPCCIHQTEHKKTICDIYTESFDTAWNGSAMRAFRNSLLSDHKPIMCQKCDLLYQ